jgi:VanZ family protein
MPSPALTLGARIALALSLCVISWLALSPGSPAMPGQTDKLAHLAAFATLALLADGAFPLRPFGWAKILPLLAYGAALELIQTTLPYRFGSVADFAADAAGILIHGLLLRPLLHRLGNGWLDHSED